MKPEPPPATPVPSPANDVATSPPSNESPAGAVCEETASALPEDVLEDWRFVSQGREAGAFDQYAGLHLAVFGQKVLESGPDPVRLRTEVAQKHQLDPDRLVIAYIDRW